MTENPTAKVPTVIEPGIEDELLKQIKYQRCSGFWYLAFKFREEFVPQFSFSQFFCCMKKLEEKRLVETMIKDTPEHGRCTYFKVVRNTELPVNRLPE